MRTLSVFLAMLFVSAVKSFSVLPATRAFSRSLSMAAAAKDGSTVPQVDHIYFIMNFSGELIFFNLYSQVTFKARVRDSKIEGPNPFTWKDVTSSDLFKGKRCVVFSLPGAFTPTCSSTHLPGYEKNYDAIKAMGIDEIYCLSVNDAFVMRQWGLHQGLPEEKTDAKNPLNPGNFQKVKLIPDGACLFTRGMLIKNAY